MKKYLKIIIFIIVVVSIGWGLQQTPSQEKDALENPVFDDVSLAIDPFFDDVNHRLFIFDRNRHFDLKTTPVDNMEIVLQSLDSFYLCEEDWMINMKNCVTYLKEQYKLHKHSLDPKMQELMTYQIALIQTLDILIREADSDCVDDVKQAFDGYVKYYEEQIIEGGTTNDGEMEV